MDFLRFVREAYSRNKLWLVLTIIWIGSTVIDVSKHNWQATASDGMCIALMLCLVLAMSLIQDYRELTDDMWQTIHTITDAVGELEKKLRKELKK